MYDIATLANIIVMVPTLFFLFCVLRGVIWNSVLQSISALFWPLDLEKKNKHKHSSTVRENYYKLTSGRSTELKLWSISWEFNWQTNKFGLSTVYNEFEAKFSGEKRRFRRQNAKLKSTLEKHGAILKQTRLRSETHWKLLLYSFRSYFEATSPNWCNIVCKILFAVNISSQNNNKKKPKSH